MSITSSSIGTYLILRNDPQFTGSRGSSRGSPSHDLRGPRNGIRVCDPITNVVGDDEDNGHSRIVLIAFVDAILEITEICRVAIRLPCQPIVARSRNKADEQSRPVLFDQLLILRHFRYPTITRPVGGRGVTKADIDVVIISDFLELIGNIVCNEDKIQLRVFESCGRARRGELKQLPERMNIRPAGVIARECK